MSSPGTAPTPYPKPLQEHKSEPEHQAASTESQYDKIGTSYNIIKQLPIEPIETFNLGAAIHPYLSNLNNTKKAPTRALDLACGTGHYTRKLVSEWGAGSVVGVDISPAMVESARTFTAQATNAKEHDYTDKVSFKVGDATSLGRVDEQGFNLVLGGWLLNYVSSEDEMADMFRTISANLNSEDGLFVGTVPDPVRARDLITYGERKNKGVVPRTRLPPWRLQIGYAESFALSGDGHRSGNGEEERGWKCAIKAFDEKGEKAVVEFETYHLPMEVFERAARKGGMTGRLEWRTVRRPVSGDSSEEKELWDQYFGFGPHFGVLVVQKGGGDGGAET